MPLFEDSLPLPVSEVGVEEEDRRFNGRRQFFAQIQVRQMDPPHAECIGTMRDLSRDGLYFVVRSQGYAIGTLLRLILPRSGSEWTCEVVRTEALPTEDRALASESWASAAEVRDSRADIRRLIATEGIFSPENGGDTGRTATWENALE